MADDLREYLRLLFDPGNPLYYSIFLTVTIFLLIFFFFRYVITPLRKKHLIEKKELELKNIKLMALFAELDPNPLLRINSDGIVIHLNDAAKNLTENTSIEGESIHKIVRSIDFSILDSIKNDQSITHTETINNHFYSILFRGISYLNIAGECFPSGRAS